MTVECVVCVPARDEEEHLPALLAALAEQGEPGLRVVVLANNCSDRTAEIARCFGRDEPRLRLLVREMEWRGKPAHAGRARGAAMETGAAWLRAEADSGLLLSTDADTLPPPHWLRAIRGAFEAGAEAVGGELRITEDPRHPLPAWLRRSHEEVAAYQAAVRDLADALDPQDHDPPPRHGDHTGASLAVTLAAYEGAGGVPQLASQEDVALVEAIERQGGRVRHPASVWVEVSPREIGRAEGGMADELRRWRQLSEAGETHSVPEAGHWWAFFRRRRALREMFRRSAFHGGHGLPEAVLREIARRSVNDIAFVAACQARTRRVLPRLAPMARVTRDLRALASTALAA